MFAVSKPAISRQRVIKTMQLATRKPHSRSHRPLSQHFSELGTWPRQSQDEPACWTEVI